MNPVVAEVAAERERQKSLETAKLDQTNTINDYVAYVSAYAGRASTKVNRNIRESVTPRDMFIKAAALAVAAVEAIDAGVAK